MKSNIIILPILGIVVLCLGIYTAQVYADNHRKFLTGELFNEQLGLTNEMADCMDWGNSWAISNNGTEYCQYGEQWIMKPIGYSVQYCDDNFGGRELCGGSATGCIENYTLRTDYWGDLMCVKNSYYDNAKCEKYFKPTWTKSGYGCYRMSDAEISQLQHQELLDEIKNLKEAQQSNTGVMGDKK